jgi:hypothetical protein
MNGHSEVRESQAAEDSQKDCLVSERQMRVGFHNTEGLHTMTGGHRKILVITHIYRTSGTHLLPQDFSTPGGISQHGQRR